MSKLASLFILSLAVLCLLAFPAFGQYKFESALRNTEDYTIPPAPSPTPTPTPTSQITVYYSGGNQAGTTQVPTNTLTDCSGNPLSNPFSVTTGAYCFIGNQPAYDVKISTDSNKTRRVISEQSVQTPGTYKLTDFGALGDASSDNTYAIKSAMAYIGTRLEPGGKLIIPNGIFKVFGNNIKIDTTLPIVLPPGLTFEGRNGRGSFGSSRIQMQSPGSTLFRIGNSTNKVVLRDLSLVFPAGCGATCDSSGTKAIYAAGNADPSFGFIASNISIQGFEEGISVKGLDQYEDWQFGSALIENSVIADCLYPVRIGAQNAEVQINNTILLTGPGAGANAGKEAALRIDRSGAVTLNRVFGGTAGRLDNFSQRPQAFIWVKGRHALIRVIESESENTQYNLLYDYPSAPNDIKMMVTFESVGFGDLVVFKGNVVFKSINSSYASNGVQFWGPLKGGNSTASEIYSYGDTFAPITNLLQVCPESPGVTATSYPPPRANGDFTRLNTTDLDPLPGNEDRNVCRRDFYLYNRPQDTNRVVARTAQRPYSTGDSDSLTATNFQAPIQISSPPVFDTALSRQGRDRFKTWGYTIGRNSSDGGLDFLGNQKPPFFDWDASFFRFNGGVFPAADNQYALGNNALRWSLVRGVVVTSGDLVLSDKETGKELYKLHEDENFIYFNDFRTGKELMRIGRDGNLYVSGKIIQNAPPANAKPAASVARKKRAARK